VRTPGLIERVPDWGEGLTQHECLTQQPLDAAQGSALTQSLLQRLNPVPAALAELIERRAEGNPYYAEELVGMLLDQGVISSESGKDSSKARDNGSSTDDISDNASEWRFHPERLNPQRLPTTRTGVLQARLDSLDRAPRPPACTANGQRHRAGVLGRRPGCAGRARPGRLARAAAQVAGATAAHQRLRRYG